MTYQTVFSELEFIVLPVIDKKEITRENWFLSQDSTEVVMSEVRKIGTYFPAHILDWGASHDKAYNKKSAPEDCNQSEFNWSCKNVGGGEETNIPLMVIDLLHQ